ncbi:N-acetylglucosamine-6-phosphate deacetylase [Cupriavidus neocaledonicus]|uniref:N-acetylglucosamine-6-phosphate deacetylase n=1 Tax=Cupriavidus neocaledonicus TaxID=1040979 RepID=A0A375H333_9BURK|nr:N-acetylglucosamine-6-phosphate deacetylase [Cupriavidus neocaledonicus]SOZ36776.1 N-acetylglucosamine-6-phosphate deacetylase [Cupriavidus neocaledonicus]SPD45356.1 N-acetylglucosamine-6-phosphate deacetylase [Cupriavidus neocaledonicus]
MKGNILTPAGWVFGELHAGPDGRIARIEGVPAAPAGNDAPFVLPGFVDLLNHGGGGQDFMDGAAAVPAILRAHARFGTTSLLAATMTAPHDVLLCAVRALGRACAGRPPGAARLLGVHLEGPYLNPGNLGAQPEPPATATPEHLAQYLGAAPLKVVTLAPEMPGHLDLIRQLAARGVRVQLGHTLGTYEDAVAALEAGASGFTHLFNAMTPLRHRAPGMVAAALAHAEFAELIPDLLHVHPGAIRAALRAIPRLYAVTDATAAAGMPDGVYHLGSQTVYKAKGSVRLADGTLAGSVLTMDQALRNLVAIGLDLADAARRVSLYPAQYLGIADRGRLAEGCWADVVVLDRALSVRSVHVEGECCVGTA